MLTGGIPLSHYDGEAIQPNLPYVDWNTNSQLLPSDVIEGIFPPDVSAAADEMNIRLTTNIREGSVQSNLQLIQRDDSTSRPGDA